MSTVLLGTRATSLPVTKGQWLSKCSYCHTDIGRSSNGKGSKVAVVANVYVGRTGKDSPPGRAGIRWDRTEQYHGQCYDKLGAPYGKASPRPKGKAKR
ncbi:MAG: hypothetical protein WDA71_13525 [Actinomycetota bacterium]